MIANYLTDLATFPSRHVSLGVQSRVPSFSMFIALTAVGYIDRLYKTGGAIASHKTVPPPARNGRATTCSGCKERGLRSDGRPI